MLSASLITCTNQTVSAVHIPHEIVNNTSPMLSDNSLRTAVFLPASHRLFITTNTVAAPQQQYMPSYRAITLWRNNMALALDNNNNLLVAFVHHIAQTHFLYAFSTAPLTFFTTPQGRIFVVHDDAIPEVLVQLHLRHNSTIEGHARVKNSDTHTCILEFFMAHAKRANEIEYLPYTSTASMSVQQQQQEHMKALFRILERVHPELLFICVVVLVPLILIALPLLAILLYAAIHIAKRLRAFK